MTDSTTPNGSNDPLSDPAKKPAHEDIDLDDGSMEGPDIETSSSDSIGSEE